MTMKMKMISQNLLINIESKESFGVIIERAEKELGAITVSISKSGETQNSFKFKVHASYIKQAVYNDKLQYLTTLHEDNILAIVKINFNLNGEPQHCKLLEKLKVNSFCSLLNFSQTEHLVVLSRKAKYQLQETKFNQTEISVLNLKNEPFSLKLFVVNKQGSLKGITLQGEGIFVVENKYGNSIEVTPLCLK